MTERPILFSAPMVRALLSGTKTQTRRPLRVQPSEHVFQVSTFHHPDPRPMFWGWVSLDGGGAEITDAWGPTPCPYGAPGDWLWVREAWRVGAKYDAVKPSDIPERSCSVLYAAGGSAANTSDGWRFDEAWPGDCPVSWAGKLRPGMFMPRWASRITLEVTGVRVERLQDISEADAIAEGIERRGECNWRDYLDHPHNDFTSARRSYRSLWESINGAGSWDANPWVWCVSFKRVEAS